MVKCKECGFLSVTGGVAYYLSVGDPAPSKPVFLEATRKARGNLSYIGGNGEFVCFAEESQYIQEASGAQVNLLDVFEKERCCDSFTEYVLGHDPKEHVAMRLQDERDTRQKGFQWRQLAIMLATVAAILVAAWLRPTLVEVNPTVYVPPVEQSETDSSER